MLGDALRRSHEEREEIDGRREQKLYHLRRFADNTSEIHALGGGLLAALVVYADAPLAVLVLLAVGIVGTWRDLLTQGHYFLLGVALVVLIREVAVGTGVVA